MPSMTPSRPFAAPTIAALAVPLLALVLAPPGAAAARPAPVADPGVATTSRQLDLAGVDAAALQDLRAEVAGQQQLLRASTEALTQDPAAVQPPTVLTPLLDVPRSTLVGVVWTPTGPADEAVVVDVRLRETGEWSDWQRLEVETVAPDADPGTATTGTEPLVSDGADGVQVRVDAGAAPVSQVRLVLVDGGDDSLVDVPAAVPSRTAADSPVQGGEQVAAAAPAVPRIVTRAQWGADDTKLNGSTSRSGSVEAIAVHHTAGTNNYTAGNAAAQVRSVYAYHTDSLGWSDVGYNFLVDRFGTVYEGRRGSITTAVRGAHAGGFNDETMGVSVMGNFETASPSSSVLKAVGDVAGWKLAQYGSATSGSVTLTSAGGGTSKVPAGQRVSVSRVFAHRDVGQTACPGANLFSRMSTVRATAGVWVPVTTPPPTPLPTPAPVEPPFDMTGPGALPLAADLDGDGTDELGWFRRGWFAFQTSTGTRYAPFGTAGDVPVTGDWDGDGKDGIGVFRGGAWFVRDTVTAGPATRSFGFGTAGDVPVVGRWAGTSIDGIGVVRGTRWHTRRSSTGGAEQHTFAFGRVGDRPVLGSWLDDGVARPGVVRGTTWHLATSIQRPVAVHSYPFGRLGDGVLVADLDGDRRQTAVTVRAPYFHVRTSHDPTSTVTSKEFTG